MSLVALALRVVSACVARLPWRALALPGAALGWLAGSVLRIRRGGVEAAMTRAGVANASAHARAMYASLGRGVFELLWLAGAGAPRRRAALDTAVELEPAARDALARALARGPVVLGASHTGNWELVAYAAARALAKEGRALVVVAKPIASPGIHAFCTHLREGCGLRLLPPAGALGAARRALAAGDVVAMPIDQVPDRARHGVMSAFLGAGALVDRAPSTLAHVAGATLLVVGAVRGDKGGRGGERQRVRVLAELVPGRGGSSRRSIARMATEATAALEAFIQASPEAWLWLHRRWRAPRSAASPARGSARGATPPLVSTSHPG